MAAYLIVHRRDINDSKALKAYADGVQKTIEDHAGEVIVRADRFEVLEGNWSPGEKQVDDHPERVTILRFPDMAALKSWYASPDYAELKQIRQTSSQSDIVAVEGD